MTESEWETSNSNVCETIGILNGDMIQMIENR